MNKNTFTKKEIALMHRLNTPAKVQDFLNKIPINFEYDGEDRVKSPMLVLRENTAHCIEGAILGAYILSLHGYEPLLMNFKVAKGDFEHVTVPFKINGYWGALSKTNHAVLRYREPVYKTIRELAMSYFHEYLWYKHKGRKTLRQYTAPLNLRRFKGYETSTEDLWNIDAALDKCKHYDCAPKKNLQHMRLADPIEIEAGDLTEWKPDKKKLKKRQ